MHVLLVALVACSLALAAAGWGVNGYCGVAPGESATAIPPLQWTGDGSSSQPQLVQVQTMFRHGDRTPASAVPCWPNATAVFSCNANSAQVTVLGNSKDSAKTNRLYRFMPIDGQEFFQGDCFAGQLTELGYEQELANGEAFRAAYVGPGKLLPSEPDASVMWFHSDQSPRVMTSTMAVIEGMYPHNHALDTVLPVVNIFTQDLQTDPTCPNPSLCPALNANAAAFINSTEFLSFNASITPLLESLAQALNMSVPSASTLFDCASVYICHNISLPDAVPLAVWTEVIQLATNLANMQYSYPSRTEFGVIGSGPYLRELLARAQAAVDNTSTVKFYASGSHDSCVMPLVAALAPIPIWSPYAAVVVFELYEMPPNYGDTHAVRMIRYGEVVEMAGCPDVLCPWTAFVAALAPMIPTTEQCALV